VEVKDGGKCVHLGLFNTAEEAAVAYARSEYGRADAAKLLQPRAAPTAAGAEAIRQAAREGLSLTTSSSSNSGYKGVTFCPSSKKYQLNVTVGGKKVFLGRFATAEQAARSSTPAGRRAGTPAISPRRRRRRRHHPRRPLLLAPQLSGRRGGRVSHWL